LKSTNIIDEYLHLIPIAKNKSEIFEKKISAKNMAPLLELSGPTLEGVFTLTFVGEKQHKLVEQTFDELHAALDKVEQNKGATALVGGTKSYWGITHLLLL
jgi:hypothetical protein